MRIAGRVLLVLALGGMPSPSAAEDDPCSTPRKAVERWLGSLPPEGDDPSRAIECFEWRGSGVSARAQKVEVARQLRDVLAANALDVDLAALPADARAGGKNRLVLFEESLPEVLLVRRDGRWLVAGSTIRAVPRLHGEAFPLDVDSFVESLPRWMQRGGFFGVAWWQVFTLLFALFVGIMVRAVVTWLVSSQSSRILSRFGERAESRILVRAARPIGTLAMTGIFWWLLPVLRFGARVNQIALIALRVLAASAVVLVLYRLVDVLTDIWARHADKTETRLDDQLVPLVRKTLKVFVIALGAIFVLQNMDVDVGSLLAAASLGGLAFTLAAKDTVANLFGSVTIFADRPFQVGDWVVIGDHEGIIEEVGMRSSRIRTFYNSLVTLPNASLTDTAVDNLGARKYRRTFVTLNLTYGTSPEQIQAFCDGIRAILRANPHVRKDYYEIHFSGFGAHSLDVMLYFFFRVDSWSEELHQRHNVLLEVLRLAKELGIEFAFPTQTLHVDSVATARPLPERQPLPNEALEAKVLAFAPGGKLSRPAGPRITHGFFAGEEEPPEATEAKTD